MKSCEICTGGAGKGNPGPGGWGAVRRNGSRERELVGSERETTNNRMEMTAVIEALSALKEPCRVDLYSDSKYVIDGITQWIHGWQKRGWLTADRKPAKNADLWSALLQATTTHRIPQSEESRVGKECD